MERTFSKTYSKWSKKKITKYNIPFFDEESLGCDYIGLDITDWSKYNNHKISKLQVIAWITDMSDKEVNIGIYNNERIRTAHFCIVDRIEGKKYYIDRGIGNTKRPFKIVEIKKIEK